MTQKKDRDGSSFTELRTAFALSYETTKKRLVSTLEKQARGCSSTTEILSHVSPDQEGRERHVGFTGLCLLQTSHIATVCDPKCV